MSGIMWGLIMGKLNQDQELMDSILAKEWHALYAEEIILVMNYAKEQQAKIDELQNRVDELEQAFKHLSVMSNKSISFEHDLFDKGWNQCAKQTVESIYRLTGIGIGE